MKRFAIIPLEGLDKQIADTITTQLASRKVALAHPSNIVGVVDPKTQAHEVAVIARNVAAPLALCEVDIEDAVARLEDVINTSATELHGDDLMRAEQLARRIIGSLFNIER